jgi:hypothetical protein
MYQRIIGGSLKKLRQLPFFGKSSSVSSDAGDMSAGAMCAGEEK